jgi:CrcB protein
VHLRPRSILLVAAGGALGTAARHLVGQAVPHVRGVPVGVLLINVLGAFLLGLLLERLLRTGPDTGGRLDLRLLLGTGLLGGFTTYSALATDTVALLAAGGAGRALAYALGTLVLGLLASLLGVWCGGRPSVTGASS